MSTLSSSSLANLRNNISVLSDVRQRYLEKRRREKQLDMDAQEKMQTEKQEEIEEKQEEEEQTE